MSVCVHVQKARLRVQGPLATGMAGTATFQLWKVLPAAVMTGGLSASEWRFQGRRLRGLFPALPGAGRTRDALSRRLFNRGTKSKVTSLKTGIASPSGPRRHLMLHCAARMPGSQALPLVRGVVTNYHDKQWRAHLGGSVG